MYVCLSMFNSLKYQSFTRYGQKLQRRKHHLKQKLSIELFRLFVFTVVPRSQKLVDISKFQNLCQFSSLGSCCSTGFVYWIDYDFCNAILYANGYSNKGW